MLWILSFHLIFMVAWFAGLFYLPRLFVYHADSLDRISLERFKLMEHRLYYYITTPAAILTSLLGFWLLFLHHSLYVHLMWMHSKLILVAILWAYHLYCGKLLYNFKLERNPHPAKFFRLFNEIPTVLLIGIILLAVVKP